MSKKPAPDERLRRPLYLYDLPPTILESLSLKPDEALHDAGLPSQIDDASTDQTTASQEDSSIPPSSQTTLGTQTCSLCGLSFVTLQEQKDHFKTDLHHYNLKQKLNGLKPVSENQFEKLMDELDVSISGSDTSASEGEDDDASRKDTTLTALLRKQASLADQPDGTEETSNKALSKTPLLWFSSSNLPENTYYGVHKALFTPAELGKEGAIIEAIKQRQLAPIPIPKPNTELAVAPGSQHTFLCMMGGGHFAAMVVSLSPKLSKHGGHGPLDKDAVILAHKTFHRYTTRRKQGGSQSANDNAKGAAHSAGATLRRYNEQALVEDVRNTLKQWKPLIDSCQLLFIRATGSTNKQTLFGPYDNQVMHANDPRIRKFPFTTRRATKDELMRAFIELTRLKVREILPQPEPTTTAETTPKPKPEPKPSPPKLTEEQETALFHTTQLQALIRRSKLPALLSYLTTNNLSASTFHFYPADTGSNRHAPTCLHLASAQGAAAVVSGLLTRAGADPTVLSAEGKTAFEVAGDRATRDAFRVARGELGEAKWDWEAARVPAAVMREEVEKRVEMERREEAERRRREEERVAREMKEKEKEIGRKKKSGGGGGGLLSGGVKLSAQEKREEEMRGLTPEQKMRVERERRARAAEERLRRMQAGAGGS